MLSFFYYIFILIFIYYSCFYVKKFIQEEINHEWKTRILLLRWRWSCCSYEKNPGKQGYKATAAYDPEKEMKN